MNIIEKFQNINPEMNIFSHMFNISYNDLIIESYEYKMGEDYFSKYLISYEKQNILDSFNDKQKDFLLINSEKWRFEFKKNIINKIDKLKESFLNSKQNPNLEVGFWHNYSNYKHKHLDNWLLIVQETNLVKEEIECLMIFFNFFNAYAQHFLTEEAEKFIKKKQEKEDEERDRYIRDEIKYWSNPDNCYNEGGGGDEWSDPDEFWT
ncbi:hypothetical protein GCM10022386_25930 [Flavobacterium cheonhonense]|uniref:Uncharacterized protein n=1 Tax=Flavobacterium cheonhonense TaxID=706185 RepID=A0ABP7UAG0_9FLAO|nr:hypothetical protein [Flavobacterium cheonhonense]